MQVIVRNRQWLGDISLRVSGSIEALFELAFINSLSVTEELVAGEAISPSIPIDRRMMNYYYTNSIEPATALIDNNYLEDNEGIGAMIIEKNFIVR